MTSQPTQDCWYLTGPTAGGKTGVGVTLARMLDAEIISLDSMALYRGMDIGTAKPSQEERLAVPHHLVDVLDCDQEFSLAQYVEAAGRQVESIRGRGREALFVGGTPLYLKGLLRGIFPGPPADWTLRHRLEAEAGQSPPGFLHRRLTEIDPAAAARLHPNDTRRLIRAIEVYEKTGRPISGWQQQFEIGRPAESCRVFVLDWDRQELYARIDRRVDAMFAAGLVDEVRRLLDGPKPLSKTARQALGYREVIEYLERQREGKRGQAPFAGTALRVLRTKGARPLFPPSLAQTVDLVKVHTRQFAKRQWTWFGSLSECRRVPVTEQSPPAEIAGRIARAGLS
jgi:tRNA dimethylallyltransferase